AVGRSREALLDDHAAGMAGGRGEAEAQLLFRPDAGGHASAVITIERLGDERIAEPPRRGLRLLGAAHDLAARDRKPAFGEAALGRVLIARQFDRHQRGAACDGGANSLLTGAVAKLHETLIVEPRNRNA